MRVSDILRRKGGEVVTIGPSATVHEAIQRLNQHGIGALLVTDDTGQLCGIITERDILRECGDRCTRLAAPAGDDGSGCPALVNEVMTADIIIGVPEDDLNYVMGIMTKNRIRHLPVLEQGKLTGIISIGDVVNAHVEEAEFENRVLQDYIHGVTY
jgi:CBS domain-containing protein